MARAGSPLKRPCDVDNGERSLSPHARGLEEGKERASATVHTSKRKV
jgi:hypothetical protein